MIRAIGTLFTLIAATIAVVWLGLLAIVFSPVLGCAAAYFVWSESTWLSKPKPEANP